MRRHAQSSTLFPSAEESAGECLVRRSVCKRAIPMMALPARWVSRSEGFCRRAMAPRGCRRGPLESCAVQVSSHVAQSDAELRASHA